MAGSSDHQGRISSISLLLHWMVAAGLLCMIGFGHYISGVPRGLDKTALLQVHKSFGMMVLVLFVIRLWWRLRRGFRPPVAPLSTAERKLSRLVHWALLVLPLVIVASGMVRSLAYARGIYVFVIPVVPRVLEEGNVALNELAGAIHDDTFHRTLGLRCGGANRAIS